MTLKINEMAPGMENVEFKAIISQVTIGKTNGPNKSNYLNIVFQDSTGTIDAKLWSARDEQIKSFTQGTVVHGLGDIIKYNNNRQMKVVELSVIEMKDTEKIVFLPKAPFSTEGMMKSLERYVKTIRNLKLYTLTNTILKRYQEEFAVYPAASRNHHEFVSGLLYHTLTMTKVADAVCGIYDDLDRDLLISGTLLHDIGKLKELSGPITPNYTVEGNLLGHISIGAMMIEETAKELHIEGEEITLLKHMILSHHGKMEYGSPVLPQIKEAEVLSLIDNMDARLNMFNKALEEVEPGGFSKRIFALENRSIYKPKTHE